MTSEFQQQWPAVQLRVKVDTARLQAELHSIQNRPTINVPSIYHDGEWTGLSLHSEGGREDSMLGWVPALKEYSPTPLLNSLPYMKEVLDALPCPKSTVRLMALPPGGIIKEHTDPDVSFSMGTIRLHLPIVTHPDVEFILGGGKMKWREGEIWYADFTLPHSVRNLSPIRRVHMVIDVLVTEELLDLFPADFAAAQRKQGITLSRPRLKMSPESLRRFEGRLVLPPKIKGITDSTEVRAELRLEQGELCVLTGGRPLFALEPVSDSELAIRGWPPGYFVEIKTNSEGAASAVFQPWGMPIEFESFNTKAKLQ